MYTHVHDMYKGTEMEKDIEDLRSLIANTSDIGRSKMGRVRSLYHEIVNAQLKGVSQAEIVAFLHKRGLEISVGNLRTMLARIKKETIETKISAKPNHLSLPSLIFKQQHETNQSLNVKQKIVKEAVSLIEEKKPGEPRKFDWEALKNVESNWD